jgi:hypothetical protein
MGQWSNVVNLSLFGNALTGTIPTEIGGMQALENFWINTNAFWGQLPTTIGLVTNLIEIVAYQNDMSGTLPVELGLLHALTKFDFGENFMVGSLPFEIGGLQKMVEFRLDANVITGSFPTSKLCQAVHLIPSNDALTSSSIVSLGFDDRHDDSQPGRQQVNWQNSYHDWSGLASRGALPLRQCVFGFIADANGYAKKIAVLGL